jgi:hypothetical protein
MDLKLLFLFSAASELNEESKDRDNQSEEGCTLDESSSNNH